MEFTNLPTCYHLNDVNYNCRHILSLPVLRCCILNALDTPVASVCITEAEVDAVIDSLFFDFFFFLILVLSYLIWCALWECHIKTIFKHLWTPQCTDKGHEHHLFISVLGKQKNRIDLFLHQAVEGWPLLKTFVKKMVIAGQSAGEKIEGHYHTTPFARIWKLYISNGATLVSSHKMASSLAATYLKVIQDCCKHVLWTHCLFSPFH